MVQQHGWIDLDAAVRGGRQIIGDLFSESRNHFGVFVVEKGADTGTADVETYNESSSG